MDVLRKLLLVAFYLIIIAVGIGGFLALKSVRDKPVPTDPPVQQMQPSPMTDSLVSNEVVK
jgi:hypothetical protein